jgi:hypothetical protein
LVVAAFLILLLVSSLDFRFSATAPAGAAGPTAGVWAVPATIPSDCSVDVTGPLEQWLTTLPAGSSSAPVVVQFAYNGCYQIDSSLTLRNFRDYTFDGNGAELKQENVTPMNNSVSTSDPVYCGDTADTFGPGHLNQSGIMWWIEGGCDITLENFNLQGSYGTGTDSSSLPQQDSLIQLNGVQRVTLTNNTFNNAWGDWITLFKVHEAPPTQGTFPSTDITITDNQMNGSGRQGISPIYVNRVLIARNTIGSVAATVIDLEADVVGGCTCDVNITSNNFDSGGNSYLVAAFTGATLTRIAFTNNQLTNGAAFKVTLSPSVASSDITIANNTASTQWVWPFAAFNFVGSISNVEVAGNTSPLHNFSGTGPQAFVANAGGTTGLAVRNNTLTGTPASFGQAMLVGPGTTCGDQVGGTHVDGSCSGTYTPPAQPQAPTLPADYPDTSIVLPSTSTYLAGSQFLDAITSPDVSGVTSVKFELSGGSMNHSVVSTATHSWVGWLGGWNTATVADGVYILQALACNAAGNCSLGTGLWIGVDNTPPTTAVVLPANGANLTGSRQNLDATTSDDSSVGSVQFEVTGGGLTNDVVSTGTLTLVGWLGIWNTAALPKGTYVLQSVATDAAGNVGRSPGITVKK